MAKRFEGKVALVTGAARGIGAAIARRLAAEGAQVVISYEKSVEKAEALAKEINGLAIKADAGDEKDIEKLIKAVVDKFGKIDILVPNAGVLVLSAVDDPKTDLQVIKHLLDVNIFGVMKLVRTAVPFMKNGSRIILIGSVAGERVPLPTTADYSATKGAIHCYARGWARDLGPKNITVNVVQPGPIDTDMTPDDPDIVVAMKRQIPLNRLGKSEEVAAAVAFLASSDADFITGSALTVDGGYNA